MADETKPIILSDESVNVYGFRVLTKGIGLSLFKANPIMLYNHRRTRRWDENTEGRLPIGKWNAVKKVEGRLLGTPEFDADDEFAVKVGGKYGKGYLNAASIGFDIVSMSEDPKDMLPGQTRPTITKCVLKEASIADIPANGNCIRLSYQGQSIELSDGSGGAVDSILPLINKQHSNKSIMDKNLILTTLGMEENSTDAAILGKLTSLVNQGDRVTELETKLADMEQAQQDGKVNALVSAAKDAGKITEGQVGTWKNLAAKDFNGTKTALDGLTAYVPPTTQIEGKDQPGDTVLSDTEEYIKLDKEGKLGGLLKTDKAKFDRLQSAFLASAKTEGLIG